MLTRPHLSDRAEYLIEQCRGKRVLHVGCGDDPFTEAKLSNGSLLHSLLSEVASRCCGVDSSVSSIELLKRHGFNDVLSGSIETLVRSGAIRSGDFDVVLAAEVLEHVSDAGRFLCSLQSLLKRPADRLIVTTPNAYCAYRWAYTMLTGRESGHPDHVAHYSRNTLTLLLKRCGLEVESVRYYSGKEYIHNRGRQRLFWWIDRIAYRLRPELGDGLIVSCKSIGATATTAKEAIGPAA
ncbi:MAG: class I SAM-dependent methyltransferase [Candidatus Binatus sp.]|uniref:class I SAM-dependent methyltransferase n=1 Tax=Candidatus Binatus sp. TaxID=2811406 RepID=UPI00272308D9|nr:class I SAM-dependent methyltransferase [Candidatus Binatus sp.]MDO8431273.1 class I SAM-dependent methyltransferase [Candidatus Binatus sp.]